MKPSWRDLKQPK